MVCLENAKEKIIISISVIMAIVVIIIIILLVSHRRFMINQFIAADHTGAELRNDYFLKEIYDPHYIMRYNEDIRTSFGRINYDDFDEVRNRSIPKKTCYIEILNYLYGENCKYAGNIKKVTYYSYNIYGAKSDFGRQVKKSIYFSEKGDSIINSLYYKEKLYKQQFVIYNNDLIKSKLTHYIDIDELHTVHYEDFVKDRIVLYEGIGDIEEIYAEYDDDLVKNKLTIYTDEQELGEVLSDYSNNNKRNYNEISYYYDGNELIEIVQRDSSSKVLDYYDKDGIKNTTHPDSFFITYTKSFTQGSMQKKQTLNSYFDSRISRSGKYKFVGLIPYESQWIWHYDDKNRLVEKSSKIVFDSSRYYDMINKHDFKYINMLKQFDFPERKYIYSYDKDTLFKVEIFTKDDKYIGILEFKNDETKRRFDYTSANVHLDEEYTYDDKNRPKKKIVNLKYYPYVYEYNKIVLFDTLSNIISDSLFSTEYFLYSRDEHHTEVKKNHYSLDGRLEKVEHIGKSFVRLIPFVGFGFTAYERKSESFVYDIKYDNIGNPNKITRKHFVDNQLLEHTEFIFDYEYYGL